MAQPIYWIVAALALPALYWVGRAVGGAYIKFRGTRVITCPETEEAAAVEVDAEHAALTAALGRPQFRLKDCSRWPERQNCGQACLGQIEKAPEDCLVRNILTRWYQGKSCVYCGRLLGEINWLQHKPALMSRDQKTVEWYEVPAENIPKVLSTHLPVCWDCHLAETFRREHPELVVDRDWKREVASNR